MIKVLIAEDEPPIARAVQRLIEELSPGFKVIGRAMNGREALELMLREEADVVFTDIRMPVMDGLRLLEELGRNWLDCLSVVLSGHQEFTYAQTALRHGAFDYLLKPMSKDTLRELLRRLEAAHAKKNIMRTVTRHVLDKRTKNPEGLVARMEQYLSDNYSQDVTNETLSVQFGYVPSYLSRIFRDQMGVSPMAYLTRLRLEMAKELLRKHRDLLVRDVAQLVGYTDVSHFSKLFKKTAGLWPSQYAGREEDPEKDE